MTGSHDGRFSFLPPPFSLATQSLALPAKGGRERERSDTRFFSIFFSFLGMKIAEPSESITFPFWQSCVGVGEFIPIPGVTAPSPGVGCMSLLFFFFSLLFRRTLPRVTRKAFGVGEGKQKCPRTTASPPSPIQNGQKKTRYFVFLAN